MNRAVNATKEAMNVLGKNGKSVSRQEIIEYIKTMHPDIAERSILPADYCINTVTAKGVSGEKFLFSVSSGNYKLYGDGNNTNIWKIGSYPFELDELKEKTGLNKRDYDMISKENRFVAIGWAHLGDLSDVQTEQDVKIKGPALRSNTRDGIVSFCKKIKEGDIVLHYGTYFKILNVGRVIKHNGKRPYYFVSESDDKTSLNGMAPNRIEVIWLFEGKSFKADFSKWQDTVHKVKKEDLSLIDDGELKDYLLRILNKEIDNETNEKSILPLKKQIILYGPPGTGKTYNSRKRAVDIIEMGING